MPSLDDLKEQLNELTTMKFVASAFTDAAATKLKNIRHAFERNRQFYDEIGNIYHLVKMNAKVKASDYPDNKNKGKVLHVAITSNQHFYGSLNINIMVTFLSASQKDEGDSMIIGATGLEFIKGAAPKKKYQKIIFHKDTPSPEEINKLMEDFIPYHRVIAYYPKYLSLLTQGVAAIDITQSSLPESTTNQEESHIIFEPELSKILEFFEEQIRLILFLRVLFETDIARTSARLVSMSSAEEKAENLIKEKKSQYRKTIKTIINTQLLETFTGIGRWGNKSTF